MDQRKPKKATPKVVSGLVLPSVAEGEEESKEHRIYLIRYANLMKLFHDWQEQQRAGGEADTLKAFALRVDMNERYFSHIKNKRKAVGNVLARRIERHLGKKDGWLDLEHRDGRYVSPDDGEQLFIETAVALFRASPSEAKTKLMQALKRSLAKATE